MIAPDLSPSASGKLGDGRTSQLSAHSSISMFWPSNNEPWYIRSNCYWGTLRLFTRKGSERRLTRTAGGAGQGCHGSNIQSHASPPATGPFRRILCCSQQSTPSLVPLSPPGPARSKAKQAGNPSPPACLPLLPANAAQRCSTLLAAARPNPLLPSLSLLRDRQARSRGAAKDSRVADRLLTKTTHQPKPQRTTPGTRHCQLQHRGHSPRLAIQVPVPPALGLLQLKQRPLLHRCKHLRLGYGAEFQACYPGGVR